MTISFNDPLAFVLSIVYAFLALGAGYWILRFITGLYPAQSADERMGNAVGFFVFLVFAAIAAVATIVMLFIGHAGIPALICLGFIGAAFGCGSRA